MSTKKKTLSVAVIMGSQSDWEIVKNTVRTLREFGVPSDVQVMSAHRTPARVASYASGAASKGCGVIIAAAGTAAHLAGVIAAHTTLPVIGIPMKGGALDGLDALLSTVQMPAGVPVATVALGRAGAVNAALLAVQILALGNPSLRRKYQAFKRNQTKKVEKANQAVRKECETL